LPQITSNKKIDSKNILSRKKSIPLEKKVKPHQSNPRKLINFFNEKEIIFNEFQMNIQEEVKHYENKCVLMP
jgi:hypothetical protein